MLEPFIKKVFYWIYAAVKTIENFGGESFTEITNVALLLYQISSCLHADSWIISTLIA